MSLKNLTTLMPPLVSELPSLMQEATFQGANIKFSKYLDSFPFPYYILLRNIEALPRTLADLLRQVISCRPLIFYRCLSSAMPTVDGSWLRSGSSLCSLHETRSSHTTSCKARKADASRERKGHIFGATVFILSFIALGRDTRST